MKVGFTTAVVAVIGGVGGYFTLRQPAAPQQAPATPPPQTVTATPTSIPIPSSTRVELLTSDKVRIIGDFWLPESARPHPVVILIHQINANRRQWDFFVPILLSNGFAVLAYDIRGFGESNRIIGNDGEAPFERSSGYYNNMTKDVTAAIDWLKTQREADSERIGVIGASVGASIAYVAAGSLPDVKTAVSISPTAFFEPSLEGENEANFSPRSVLFMSDEFEDRKAADLYSKTEEPKAFKVYSVRAHGVELLSELREESRTARNDVLEWLQANL